MKKRKRLVIPVLLGLFCICLFPVAGNAAGGSSQSMTLTLEVPEKPDAWMEAPAEAGTLADLSLPDEWVWQDTSILIQPGRTVTAVAVYQDSYEMEIEVTGTLVILPDGTDKTYEIGKDSSASIHCNGVLDALVSVEMDGTMVDPSDYTTEDGSTIVTFQKEYLETLSAGTHTVTLNYETGSVDSDLEIKKSSTVTPTTTPTPTPESVTTTPTPTPGSTTTTTPTPTPTPGSTTITPTPTSGSTGNTGNTGNTGSTGTTGTSGTGSNLSSTGTNTSTGAKTGDDTNVAGMMGLLAASLGVGIIFILLIRRRKEH